LANGGVVLGFEKIIFPVSGYSPKSLRTSALSDVLTDPLLLQILQEFSIKQGLVGTKKEPESGEFWNLGLNYVPV
jgi:hypothetical protein